MTEDQARQRVIASMCPDRVCRVCGEPSRRITEKTPEYRAHLDGKLGRKLAPVGERLHRVVGEHRNSEVVTVGFSDCGHDDWRPGVWLDPFAAAGEK